MGVGATPTTFPPVLKNPGPIEINPVKYLTHNRIEGKQKIIMLYPPLWPYNILI